MQIGVWQSTIGVWRSTIPHFGVGGEVARPAIGLWQSANVVWQSSLGVWQSIIGVWQGTTGVWQSTTGVWQSANGVWQRSLANCSAQKPISAGVLLTFFNLFAIPPGPPPALEVANGAAGASVELQGGLIRV